MSFVDLKGSSSEIIINKALKFIEEKVIKINPSLPLYGWFVHIPFMRKSGIEKFKSLDKEVNSLC